MKTQGLLLNTVHAGLQGKLTSRPRPEQEWARGRAVSVYLSIVYLDNTKHLVEENSVNLKYAVTT